MADVCRNRTGAGGVRPDEYAIRIAFVLRDVLLHPVDHASDVLGGLVPLQPLAGTALHVHAGHSVLHGPQHDVVVEGVALRYRLDLIARAARNVDQHWTLLPSFSEEKTSRTVRSSGKYLMLRSTLT